jgi:predicted NUDIX family NTP pyrophosphohydrolase
VAAGPDLRGQHLTVGHQPPARTPGPAERAADRVHATISAGFDPTLAEVAMARRSAGILLYRPGGGSVEVLLVHPGGPFWANKDLGAWSIPKGEYQEGEDPLAVAVREFEEETGQRPPADALVGLGEVRQRGGKVVAAWAAPGDLDPATLTSNTFSLEWPPRSGTRREFPEVDRAGWFDPATAREKLVAAQAELIDRLLAALADPR